MIASSTLESLADSKVVVFDGARTEVYISFGLRMRHARRLVAFVLVIFWWRLWRLSSSCANFPWLRIVEICHLSVALVVKWIELRDTAVRAVPAII